MQTNECAWLNESMNAIKRELKHGEKTNHRSLQGKLISSISLQEKTLLTQADNI